jgi:hypothetical protein
MLCITLKGALNLECDFRDARFVMQVLQQIGVKKVIVVTGQSSETPHAGDFLFSHTGSRRPGFRCIGPHE